MGIGGFPSILAHHRRGDAGKESTIFGQIDHWHRMKPKEHFEL